MVARGKASSGSIPERVGCVLLLLAGETSKRRTVVAGGVVRPLAVKASGNNIPDMAGACCFSWLTRQASNCGGRIQGQQQ